MDSERMQEVANRLCALLDLPTINIQIDSSVNPKQCVGYFAEPPSWRSSPEIHIHPSQVNTYDTLLHELGHYLQFMTSSWDQWHADYEKSKGHEQAFRSAEHKVKDAWVRLRADELKGGVSDSAAPRPFGKMFDEIMEILNDSQPD